MPRAPRISAQKLIRVLKKLGFIEHSERGSAHLVFSHPDGRRTTISRHSGKDIKKGTLAGILRDLKISSEEFRRLL
jgi:predicted RNA binding protein YcfA (HicA-like mRNA interferase family)